MSEGEREVGLEPQTWDTTKDAITTKLSFWTPEPTKLIKVITTTDIVNQWTPSERYIKIALIFVMTLTHLLYIDFQLKNKNKRQQGIQFFRSAQRSAQQIHQYQISQMNSNIIWSTWITVHCNQWKPIFPVHAISCEIDPKCWLGKLRWNFLSRQSYFPTFIEFSTVNLT